MGLDLQRRRTQAWASLVGEVSARATSVREVVRFVRARPGLWRKVESAREEAGGARRTLAAVQSALASPAPGLDASTIHAARAWAECMDDILQLTEQLCAKIVDEPAVPSAAAA